VYATVPATSTQGAIKAEDKAKQAVGGIQLCRLSFPPNPKKHVDEVVKIIEDAVKKVFE
jgi:cysteine synthase A